MLWSTDGISTLTDLSTKPSTPASRNFCDKYCRMAGLRFWSLPDKSLEQLINFNFYIADLH